MFCTYLKVQSRPTDLRAQRRSTYISYISQQSRSINISQYGVILQISHSTEPYHICFIAQSCSTNLTAQSHYKDISQHRAIKHISHNTEPFYKYLTAQSHSTDLSQHKTVLEISHRTEHFFRSLYHRAVLRAEHFDISHSATDLIYFFVFHVENTLK